MTRYRTIVADPPWPHPGTGSLSPGWRTNWAVTGREPLAYPSLSIEEIAALPVSAITAKSCRMFLWATNTVMPEAFTVLDRWGFAYRQTLVWRKPDANPVGGSVAPNAEFILVGVRGSPSVRARIPNAVMSHPRGGLTHSQKPEMWIDLIEAASPGPYLEMFSRRARLGWDTYGDEALGGTSLLAVLPLAHPDPEEQHREEERA